MNISRQRSRRTPARLEIKFHSELNEPGRAAVVQISARGVVLLPEAEKLVAVDRRYVVGCRGIPIEIRGQRHGEEIQRQRSRRRSARAECSHHSVNLVQQRGTRRSRRRWLMVGRHGAAGCPILRIDRDRLGRNGHPSLDGTGLKDDCDRRYRRGVDFNAGNHLFVQSVRFDRSL